jgi:hypothetical protein
MDRFSNAAVEAGVGIAEVICQDWPIVRITSE